MQHQSFTKKNCIKHSKMVVTQMSFIFQKLTTYSEIYIKRGVFVVTCKIKHNNQKQIIMTTKKGIVDESLDLIASKILYVLHIFLQKGFTYLVAKIATKVKLLKGKYQLHLHLTCNADNTMSDKN